MSLLYTFAQEKSEYLVRGSIRGWFFSSVVLLSFSCNSPLLLLFCLTTDEKIFYGGYCCCYLLPKIENS